MTKIIISIFYSTTFLVFSNLLLAANFDRKTFFELNQAKETTRMFMEDKFAYSIKGSFDVEAKKMQKTMPGEEEKYFSLSNATLILENDLTKKFFVRITPAYYDANRGQGDPYQNSQIVMLDDAFFVFIPTDALPFFMEAGRFYLPFGLYDRYTVRPRFTQMITESRSEGLQFGFVNWGHFSLTAYLVQGYITPKDGNIQGELNYGGAFLYKNKFDGIFSFLLGVQYMRNMLNTNALAEGGSFLNSAGTGKRNFYTQFADGVSSEIEMAFHFLSKMQAGATFQMASTLKRSDDLAKLRKEPSNPESIVRGARPSTYDVGLFFSDIWGELPVRFDASFQYSNEAGGLYVYTGAHNFNHPFSKQRFTVSGTFQLTSYFGLQALWGHNYLYGVANGDSGRYGDDAVIRMNLDF